MTEIDYQDIAFTTNDEWRIWLTCSVVLCRHGGKKCAGNLLVSFLEKHISPTTVARDSVRSLRLILFRKDQELRRRSLDLFS